MAVVEGAFNVRPSLSMAGYWAFGGCCGARLGAAVLNALVEAPLRLGGAALIGTSRCHGLLTLGLPERDATRNGAVVTAAYHGLHGLRFVYESFCRAVGMGASVAGAIVGMGLGLCAGALPTALVAMGFAGKSPSYVRRAMTFYAHRSIAPSQGTLGLASSVGAALLDWLPTPAATLCRYAIHPSLFLPAEANSAEATMDEIQTHSCRLERLTLAGQRGARLDAAWMVPPGPPARRSLVVALGNAMRWSDPSVLTAATRWCEMSHANILFCSSRGVDASDGNQRDTSDHIDDVRTALREALKNEGVVGGIGLSLGGSVIVKAAASLETKDIHGLAVKQPAFIVAERSFSSLPDVAVGLLWKQLGSEAKGPLSTGMARAITWTGRALGLDTIDAANDLQTLTQHTKLYAIDSADDELIKANARLGEAAAATACDGSSFALQPSSGGHCDFVALSHNPQEPTFEYLLMDAFAHAEAA